MNYLLNLFTPETWNAFCESGSGVTGIRHRYRRLAREGVSQGDFLICYLTRLSRWCGLLEVQSEAYSDDSPIFDDPDPYSIRFKVNPTVVLEPELSIPIYGKDVWDTLSITKNHEKGSRTWTGFFRSPLNRFDDEDGNYLANLLIEQQENRRKYQFSEKDERDLSRKKMVRVLDREVEVEVPDHEDVVAEFQSMAPNGAQVTESRESIQMQAKVAQMGAEMGFYIWVPRNDRARVLEHVPSAMHEKFLDILPLNYNDTTLRTIEQIDVIWLKRRSMARAFEIEHTTAIYSGLLRMADLLALQPNMDIRLHIVAPDERRESVLREIKRPVFSLLDRGPLYEQCSFLSYNSVHTLGDVPHLSYMSDAIINEYEETSEV